MSLDDDPNVLLPQNRIRRTLLWLIEINDRPNLPKLVAVCAACGHERSAHVIAGDADNPTPWPCKYPMILGAPYALCSCNDYLEPTDDDT